MFYSLLLMNAISATSKGKSADRNGLFTK